MNYFIPCCGLFKSHGVETLQSVKWGLLQIIPCIREPCILCITLPGVFPGFLTMVLNVDSAIPNLVASATHFLYYRPLRLECPFSVRREDFTLVQFTHQINQNQEFSKTVWWFNSLYIYKEIPTQQLIKSGNLQSIITSPFQLIKYNYLNSYNKTNKCTCVRYVVTYYRLPTYFDHSCSHQGSCIQGLFKLL